MTPPSDGVTPLAEIPHLGWGVILGGSSLGEFAGSGAVGAHAVAVAGDVADGGSVEVPVEHGRGDGGVVEDVAP